LKLQFNKFYNVKLVKRGAYREAKSLNFVLIVWCYQKKFAESLPSVEHRIIEYEGNNNVVSPAGQYSPFTHQERLNKKTLGKLV